MRTRRVLRVVSPPIPTVSPQNTDVRGLLKFGQGCLEPEFIHMHHRRRCRPPWLSAVARTPGHKLGPATRGGRQPPPPSVLSKPSAPAPRMCEVSTEMFRPPLPLELGGALADKLRRSSRRSVPATAFLRQLGYDDDEDVGVGHRLEVPLQLVRSEQFCPDDCRLSLT
ncbi:hypothetical protein HPB50_012698 [Hyalomma asiaticum]|uniref:Uncharacterized protein n=1 Tax=Hyalomma asiaticum TaxID=266040 RepID=A0ACB7TJU3_HYAAI|nr:hypothetical protein HPB50_012698 [Hyalomma asiaticum]